jgi:hypothetical protein
MMIDAFAIVTILNGEPDGPALANAIGGATVPYVSYRDLRDDNPRLRAFRQGYTSRRVEYGRLLRLASARAYQAPLLFNGNDFTQIDVLSALDNSAQSGSTDASEFFLMASEQELVARQLVDRLEANFFSFD